MLSEKDGKAGLGGKDGLSGLSDGLASRWSDRLGKNWLTR